MRIVTQTVRRITNEISGEGLTNPRTLKLPYENQHEPKLQRNGRSSYPFAHDETGRQLGDRFREYFRDVERMTRTHPYQSLDTLTFLIILSSILQFATFPYIQVVKKAAKL